MLSGFDMICIEKPLFLCLCGKRRGVCYRTWGKQIFEANEPTQGPLHIFVRSRIEQEIGSSSDLFETEFDSFS
jgi:hypothetical protein